jgi:hypothetical protein
MCGRETLATDESSTSMNVAMLTVTAMSHGLCLGTQGRSLKKHLLVPAILYRIV